MRPIVGVRIERDQSSRTKAGVCPIQGASAIEPDGRQPGPPII